MKKKKVSKKKKAPSELNIRNVHAANPVMRKGGVHQSSKGALRAAAKRELKKSHTREWSDRSSFFKAYKVMLRLLKKMSY